MREAVSSAHHTQAFSQLLQQAAGVCNEGLKVEWKRGGVWKQLRQDEKAAETFTFSSQPIIMDRVVVLLMLRSFRVLQD